MLVHKTWKVERIWKTINVKSLKRDLNLNFELINSKISLIKKINVWMQIEYFYFDTLNSKGDLLNAVRMNIVLNIMIPGRIHFRLPFYVWMVG